MRFKWTATSSYAHATFIQTPRSEHTHKCQPSQLLSFVQHNDSWKQIRAKRHCWFTELSSKASEKPCFFKSRSACARPSIHNLSTYSPLTFQNQKIAVAKQNDWIHFHPSVMPKYEESYNLWREPRCFPPKGLLTKILFWQSWGWIQSSWKLQKFGLCFVI